MVWTDYSALRCLASIVVADSTLQDALFNPEEALELKIVEVKTMIFYAGCCMLNLLCMFF